jgi:solute carrier family 25 phosphate transporter 23/24/25/41
MIKIYQDGGIFSFFKGNGLNVLKIMPESALKFYVFETTKGFLAKRGGTHQDHLSLGERLIAGGMGGLVSQFAIYPIETIKTRIMSQIMTSKDSSRTTHKETSISDTMKHLYREGGVRAFYRGCVPALIGIVPYAGVDLAVFETLKSTYSALYNEQSMPIPLMLCCGMFSGTCGAVLMYPLSLVRTR